MRLLIPFSLILLMAVTSCRKTCFEDIPACQLDPDPGVCLAAIPKYYFDREEGICKEFTWGGCGGTVPFDSLEACKICECD